MPPVVPSMIVAYDWANQVMAFSRANLNQLLKYRALNSQTLLNQMNVFGHLELNNDGEFELSYFKPTVLSYRACDNTCAWTPSGQLETGKTSATPECVQSQNEFCVSEQLTRLFTQIVKQIRENNNVITPQTQQLIDAYAVAYADSLMLSSQALLSAGNSYDASVTVAFKAGVSATTQADFNRTKIAATGYVRRFKNLATTDAANYGHLNDVSILPTTKFNVNDFTGDVVDTIREMVVKTKPEFRTAISQGIQVVGDYVQRPVCIMSASIFNKLATEFNVQGESAALENAPIRRQNITVTIPSAAGGTVTHNLDTYTVDNIVCVLDASINYYDQFITSALHFICLTVTGNIHLGTTVGDTKKINGDDYPLKVQQATSLKEEGKVFMTSKSLIATLIGDSNFIVASQRITTPV